MKKMITLVIACIFSTAAMAKDPICMNKKGMEAEYVTKNGKGEIMSYAKSVVTDVNSTDAKNFTVTYSTEAFDKNKKSLASPVETTIEVKDGAIVTDPTVGMNVKAEGTFPTMPVEISVGEEYDYSYTIKMGLSKTTSSGKNSVVAKENVSTEAGSFDTYKVESVVSTKVMKQNTEIKVTSWYAEGIGAVKTETYDSKGNVETVTELVSYKK